MLAAGLFQGLPALAPLGPQGLGTDPQLLVPAGPAGVHLPRRQGMRSQGRQRSFQAARGARSPSAAGGPGRPGSRVRGELVPAGEEAGLLLDASGLAAEAVRNVVASSTVLLVGLGRGLLGIQSRRRLVQTVPPLARGGSSSSVGTAPARRISSRLRSTSPARPPRSCASSRLAALFGR